MSNLNASIQSQTSSMEESSTAMDDMAVSVQRIAESASSVAELAVATSEHASDGSTVIQKSVSQMTTIHEAVNATSEVVERLIIIRNILILLYNLFLILLSKQTYLL